MSRTIRDITNQAMSALSGGGSGSCRVCGRCKSNNVYSIQSKRRQCCKTCGAISKDGGEGWTPYVFTVGAHKGKDIDSVATEYLDRVLEFEFLRKKGYKGPWLRVRDFVRAEKQRRTREGLSPATAFDKAYALKLGTQIHRVLEFELKPPPSMPDPSKETLGYLEKVRKEIYEKCATPRVYFSNPEVDKRTGVQVKILETGRIPAKKVPIIEKDRRTMCSSILWK